MKLLKERFLNYSIYKQIHLGIMSVSVCVCILVCLVLFVNTFILITSSYSDVITILDNTENREMDLYGNFIDIQLTLIKDFSKNGIQLTRNLYENLIENYEFVDSFTYINLNKYIRNNKTGGYEDCNTHINNLSCIVYFNFTMNSNTIKIKNSLFFTFPFIRNNFNYRFLGMSNTTLYEYLYFLFNEEKSLFVYPFANIDETFNVNDLDNLMKNYANSTNLAYKKLINNSIPINVGNTNFEINNISKLLINSPLISLNDNKKKISIEKAKDFKSFSTTSFYFKLDTNNETVGNFNNIVNTLIGEWPNDILNTLIYKDFKKFSGTYPIISFFESNQQLITQFYCFYFIKYYEITSGLNNNSNNFENFYKINNISDCIIDNNMKSLFNNYYSHSDMENFEYVKRKTQISLINIKDSSEKLFKIFRIISPDIYTKFIVNSDYFISIFTYIYIIRDPTNGIYFKELLAEIFTSVIYLFLYCNFTVWYLNIMLITYLLISVTSRISKPINKLIDLVISMGKEENENRNTEELEQICYPDDHDIDDFFQICKNLIRGGFPEETHKYHRTQFLSTAYNNISYIKINNIIIEEESIEKLSSHSANVIFRYNKNKSDEALIDVSKSKVTLDLDRKSFMIFDKENSNSLITPPRKSIMMADPEKFLDRYEMEFRILNDNNTILDLKNYKTIESNTDNFKDFKDKKLDLLLSERKYRKNSILKNKESLLYKDKTFKNLMDMQMYRIVDEIDKNILKRSFLNNSIHKIKYFFPE